MDFFLYILFALAWLGAGCFSVLLGSVLIQRYDQPATDVTLGSLDEDLKQAPSFAKVMVLVWPVFLGAMLGAFAYKTGEIRIANFSRALNSRRIFPDRLVVWPPSRWGVKAKSPRD